MIGETENQQMHKFFLNGDGTFDIEPETLGDEFNVTPPFRVYCKSTATWDYHHQNGRIWLL